MLLEQYKESSISLIFHQLVKKLIGPLIVVSKNDYRKIDDQFLIRIQTYGGEHFDIYYQEHRFMVQFHRFCFRNKHFVLYKFNSIASEKLDPRIKEVIGREVIFPDIRFRFFNKKHNDHFLLNAYLDTILTRLKQKKETWSSE